MSTTTLPGSVQPAATAQKGFDADTILTSSTATSFAEAGFKFCARYLSLGSTQSSGDLSNSEAINILNAGLCLVAVQHVRSAGWAPNATLGTQYGSNAASNAASVGLPQGMNIWCDLEGIASGTAASVVIDYCQAWYTAVASAGYVPGLYVGASCILNGDQLYDLPFQHYWQSCSKVPALPARGYQLVQSCNSAYVLAGVGYDLDNTQTDSKGGSVLWLAP